MMPDNTSPGEYQGCNLEVMVEDVLVGYFTECSGIGSEHEIIQHRLADEETGREWVVKVPGVLIWHDVTLERGITSDMSVWEWRQMVVEGNVGEARKKMVIHLLDNEGAPVATWHFENAWPRDVEGYCRDDGCFVEKLIIVHEGVVRTNGD